MDFGHLRVALVADWLCDRGGAELVIEHILEIFPQADVYASVIFPRRFTFLRDHRCFESFIAKIPFLAARPKIAGVLRPYAFESFDLSSYDLVISSASAEAKGVITRPETLHICYCHTPPRYYWSQFHEYRQHMEFGSLDGMANLVMGPLIHTLRQWDALAGMRPDFFVANSANTAKRIEKYYRRDSSVIHPGIDTDQFVHDAEKEDFYLAVGRVIPYKRFDILTETFRTLPQRCLKIATSVENPHMRQLQKKSPDNVEWIVGADRSEIARLYAHARAYLMPQEEDFGLTPIEAMASGTPVIAYARGGVLETVEDGTHGMLFATQESTALHDAIAQFETKQFDREAIRAHAEQFDKTVFQSRFSAFISARLQEWSAR